MDSELVVDLGENERLAASDLALRSFGVVKRRKDEQACRPSHRPRGKLPPPSGSRGGSGAAKDLRLRRHCRPIILLGATCPRASGPVGFGAQATALPQTGGLTIAGIPL